MPSYVTLLRFTQAGIENVKDSPSRLERARKVAHECGLEFKAAYFTVGQYDLVIFGEAANDEAYAAALLATTSAGNVRAETLRAFNEEEYREIVAAIP
jgi:uncharacterized protein with GYD domain